MTAALPIIVGSVLLLGVWRSERRNRPVDVVAAVACSVRGLARAGRLLLRGAYRARQAPTR